ncbi:Uncharacterized protein HZ326_11063 [Fusarium oxysporum f. sp. albedinis]|nr:Uncharacterized protein HZ326_11063 [Fusarium oxysporum f. sp. albedinis]
MTTRCSLEGIVSTLKGAGDGQGYYLRVGVVVVIFRARALESSNLGDVWVRYLLTGELMLASQVPLLQPSSNLQLPKYFPKP